MIFLLHFNILLIDSGTSRCENKANRLYDIQDSHSFEQTKMMNNIENNNNFVYSSSSFLHTYPENGEGWKQNFSKLDNDHEKLRSKLIYSDGTINSMSEQPKYIPDHKIGSLHIDQEINNGFLEYERCISYNDTTSYINGKTFQLFDTNISDIGTCKSNNSEFNRNLNYNKNIDSNRTGENKQEPPRLSSFDTLKNYLNFVRSDNISYAAKDVDIEPQSFNTEISFHDTLKYGQDSIVKESSTNYDNLENLEAIYLLPQEHAYHNKIIYDHNAFTKEYIDTEINSANNEYTQTGTFNALNNEAMHHAQHSVYPDSNINLENVEKTDHEQWIFPTYSNRNIQENNMYANYGNYTNLSYPSTFSHLNTVENCYISQNNYTNSGIDLDSKNQIFLSDHNCRGLRKDEKNTYLTNLNTTNESNFNIKNQSSLLKTNAFQDLINDNYLIHCNDNFQKTNTVDLQNGFYEQENSVFDSARKQNNLHQTNDAYFLNNQFSYEHNMPLPKYFSEKQTDYEQYIKSPLLSCDKKKENQLQLGNNIRISKNKQSILSDKNDEQKIKIISYEILDRKNSYLVSQELKSKNDQFIHNNSISKKKRKIKNTDEDEDEDEKDKASDKVIFFENCITHDNTIIKKHIENIFNYKKGICHLKEEDENSKNEIFNNKPSYNTMIDYLLSSIIEHINLENSREKCSNPKNIIYQPNFSVVIHLIKKILVIEDNDYFKTHYGNIKTKKYKLKEHVFTKTFYKELERTLNILSSLKFFNLFLPEFLFYNDKYSLESCFEKEDDIQLDILQIRYFLALTKFVDKVHTSKTKTFRNNIRYCIRKFTFIALQPFLKCNFKKIYNNLIVKSIKPSNRKVINNDTSFNINEAIYNMENIKYLCNSYHIRFLFLYTDFQKICENNIDIFDGAKNFDERYIYYKKTKYERKKNKKSIIEILILQEQKLSEIIHQIRKNEKYWIPYFKIFLIYFHKMHNMDLMNEKMKLKIKEQKDKIIEFFISYVLKMEKLENIKNSSKLENEFSKKNDTRITKLRKNKNINESSYFYKLCQESKNLIFEIEELENLELQKCK